MEGKGRGLVTVRDKSVLLHKDFVLSSSIIRAPTLDASTAILSILFDTITVRPGADLEPLRLVALKLIDTCELRCSFELPGT